MTEIVNIYSLAAMEQRISHAKKVIRELNEIGIRVEENAGYSDKNYRFIGALAEQPENPGNPWIFSEPGLGEFIASATLFLKGYKYKKNRD